MQFVTLHELSKEFDLAARVVRYRFHQLRQANKLIEGADWRREDYVDDQHFIWKINPLSFIRETGLTPASQRTAIPASPSVTQSESIVNELGNDSDSRVNNPVNEPERIVTETHQPGNHVDDNNRFSEPPRRFEHEIIDFLKEQIRTKDGQLREQGEQLRDLNKSNVQFMGALVQQTKRIEELMRLTSGQPPFVNKVDNTGSTEGNRSVNEVGGSGNQTVNHVDAMKGTTYPE
jgi:hypothetical protein